MIELKQKMLIEIKDYIRRTGDYSLQNFISQAIINYMNKHKVNLMWYLDREVNDLDFQINIITIEEV